MYKPTFSCADDEEQFNEKVLAIELEKQKEIDRNIEIEAEAYFHTFLMEKILNLIKN